MKELHMLVVLIVVIFLVAMLLLLPGCGRTPAEEKAAAPAPTKLAPATAPHGLDAAKVARGAQLYKANCAVCHGANAEGAPNWHRPGPDGKYPAPPLNGTGHDWHHPTSALKWTIREGTGKLGGNMPAWKDKLTDGDIEAVIAWFQSLWPEEVYKNWALMDAKARREPVGR
jgi:mono/diheme cytochrome c family protein